MILQKYTVSFGKFGSMTRNKAKTARAEVNRQSVVWEKWDL